MAYISQIQIGQDTDPYIIEPRLYAVAGGTTANITASITNFTLASGVTVYIKVSGNTDNATLNVNSTGAIDIYYNDDNILSNTLKADHIYAFVYDGTYWQLIGDIDTNITQSHTHGNIQYGGTLDTALRAVITDEDNKITVADLSVDSPSVPNSGTTTATAFIDTISQDAQGKITATKKNVSIPLSNVTGTNNLQVIEALTGTGLLKKTDDETWTLDSTSYSISTHTHGLLNNNGTFDDAPSLAVVTNSTSELTTTDLSVTDNTASTNNTTTFVQAVTQNSIGQITVTKAALDTSGSWTGTANYVTTTSSTDSIYLLGVKSNATSTLLYDTSVSIAQGKITIGARETTSKPSAETAIDRIIITPYYRTDGPWKIKSSDTSANAFLKLYYGDDELLKIKDDGTFITDLTANITGNAATSTEGKYLMNRGSSDITIGDSGWNIQITPSGHTNRATVWHQKWTQSNLTYTKASDGTTPAVTDAANINYWLSSSNTSNSLSLNMQIDGIIYSAGGFHGNGANLTSLSASNISSGTLALARLTKGAADTALMGKGNSTAPAYVNVSPSISITAGDGSNAPKINLTVLGVSGSTAQAITTASTSVYGVTKLSAAADNSSLAATAKSVYDLSNTITGLLAAADAMIFKGTIDGTNGSDAAGSTNRKTLPATHNAGWTYRVKKEGTYAIVDSNGRYCEIGTLIICVADGTSANAAHWTAVETNEDGAVIGPASSTANAITRWDGTTGRIIKNSMAIISDTGSISTTREDTTDVNYKVTNQNGSVSIYTSTNRGLYDHTASNWIVKRLKDGSKTYIPQWGSTGSSTTPVYFNSNGEPTTCTAYADAIVAKAGAADLTTTQNGIARYSNTSGTFADSGITIDDDNILTLPAEANKGYIYKNYTNASTTPVIVIGSNNKDINLLRVYSSDATYADTGKYGFNLRYMGVSTGVNNELRFYADNQTGTETIAISMNQAGQVGIGTGANTDYRLYSNGDTYINGKAKIATSLTIDNENAAKHLEFTSDTYNYICFPSEGELRFSTAAATAASIRLGLTTSSNSITSGYIYPGVTNTVALGSSSLKWSNVYATTFTGNLDGNATTATALQTINISSEDPAVDLNDLKDAYKFYYAGGSNNVVNNPGDQGTSFGLTVKRIASGYRLQDYISSGGVRYYRIWNSATWGTWNKLLTSENTSAGTNNTATLDWNTTYTIAKINNTDIKFTTMAKPSYAYSDISNRPTSIKLTGAVTGSVNLSNGENSISTTVNHTHNYAGADSAGGAANSLKNFNVTTTTSVGLDITTSVIGYIGSLTAGDWNYQHTDGALYGHYYSDKWKAEIYQDYRTGQLSVRGKNNGTWQSWRRIIDDTNAADIIGPFDRVKQSGSVSTKWRKVLVHYTEDNNATDDVTSATNVVYASKYVAISPKDGKLRATSYIVNDYVTLQWNATDQSLDFIFT